MASPETCFPRYHLPTGLAVRIAASLLAGKTRSFKQDAQAAVAGISDLRVCGSLPDLSQLERGCMVTVNHYHRPGFLAMWIALAVSAAFPAELHWGMTSAFTQPDPIRSLVLTPISTAVLLNLAKLYGFTPMPPMPPRPEDLTERALAVRGLVRYARAVERPLIGFAPEGMDHPGGRLASPPPGAGRLIGYLAGRGLGIQPVGVYEEGGSLILNFGAPYFIDQTGPADHRTADAAVSNRVMAEIARCLPARLCSQSGSPAGAEGERNAAEALETD